MRYTNSSALGMMAILLWSRSTQSFMYIGRRHAVHTCYLLLWLLQNELIGILGGDREKERGSICI